ncbi:Emp24/gp25L/p24 family protein [Cooperia oncophora]
MILLGANVLIQDNMKVDGAHRMDLQLSGDYQFCFDNSFSYQSRKVVFFEVFLLNEQGQLDQLDYSRTAQHDVDLEKKMEELGVTVTGFRLFLRRHEAPNRAVMMLILDRSEAFWSCTHDARLC